MKVILIGLIWSLVGFDFFGDSVDQMWVGLVLIILGKNIDEDVENIYFSENKKLIEKQQENINYLKELLPKCSHCKRIKDDDGYWRKLEPYIEARTNSQFSHCLCNDCADELYEDQEW